MSHPEQLGFFSACVAANRELLAGARVLEIGSCDVNGSVRRIFGPEVRYVGVDLASGPSVDVVADGASPPFPTGQFDVVVSGECFEHNPVWAETLREMVDTAREGGVVAFTCASRGRVEHGTRRTSRHDSPGTQAVGWDYYRNVHPEDLEALPLDEWFSSHRSWYLPTSADLYFCGIKRADGAGARPHPDGALPSDAEVRALADLMPPRLRLIRLPLRLVSRLTLSDRAFQRLAVPYWRGVERAVRAKQAVTRSDRSVGYGPS